ncbi:MAG: hypothetical protein ABI443_01890 [Chthoniobacterales bacterium]
MNTTTPASRLCSACGMCCNGVLFHLVELQPKESAKELLSAGMKLKWKNKRQCFEQPCQAHRDGACTVYALRPRRCQIFECQQLQRVASGKITEEEAMQKIQETVAKVEQIEGLFQKLGNTNRKRPLTKRYELIMAISTDAVLEPEGVAMRNELTQAVEELEAVLTQDFKLPE